MWLSMVATHALCLGIFFCGFAISQEAFAQLYYSPHEDMDTTTVAFSPDGKYLLSAGFHGDIRLWRRDSCELQGIVLVHDPRIPPNEVQKEFPEYLGFGRGILSLAWSPDGAKFVFGLRDRTVRLYSFNPESSQDRLFEELHVYDGHLGGVRAVAYSPDGEWVASGGHDESVLLWNVEQEGGSVRKYCCHAGMVNAVTFSPDGRYVLSGSTDSKVRVWDMHTGEIIKEFQSEGEVYSVGYSSDGLYIGAPEDSYTEIYGRHNPIILWNLTPGKEQRQLLGHVSPSWAVDFSPNGRHLASAGQDGKVMIWEVSTGKVFQELTDPKEQHSFRSISYSPDGKYIVAGNQSGPLPLWDVETGKLVREFGKCHQNMK